MELFINAEGAELPATLTVPQASRAGLVVLHGSGAGERDYFLYEHLSRLLPDLGVAVLRYDRRPAIDGHDVPFELQTDDAATALQVLGDHVPGVPLGAWGYSQGAWAAALLAVRMPELIRFLIVVSGSGVSPAEQMRAGSAEQLRRQGFAEADVADMLSVRRTVEAYLRSGTDRRGTQAVLDQAMTRAWFPWASLAGVVSEPGTWHDMDFDPRPVLDQITCPTLALYGETDEWIPLPESIAAWSVKDAHGTGRDVTIAQLRGADHLPTLGGVADPVAITNDYERVMSDWLQHRLTLLGRGSAS
ncbi:S9 family peptidase [Curtobacterium sp. MCBA15_001]|uniref:alpha/beta hydrolase family protein n=1 Tax=Curtobacterium sp. MCBA15_001 TaxID=1898731 RepID=UPI0008DD7569|nr:alpha/beta hydrolase [Curtobacterium sp. MCBA15_001]OIH93447.1 hypothetical protein BIU90_07060 [Curtobacterium sp. MCBA15_001]